MKVPIIKVLVMVGIPASGKSTTAEDIAAHWAKTVAGGHCYRYSRDEIRFEMLADGEDYFAHEDEVEKKFYSSIKNKIKELNSNPPEAARSIIIVDATHINKASRAKLMRKINCGSDIEIEYRAAFMNTPLKEALERNAKREGLAHVPEKVIQEMYKKLEAPTEEEGFKKIFVF